jgi:DNA-binding CsgD family transcriptional regulator
MRYTTLVLIPPDEACLDDQQQGQTGEDRRQIWVNDTIVATQEALHYVNLLNDGTAVGVGRFSGDSERMAMMETDTSWVLTCTVTDGETWLAYLHYEPDRFEKALLEIVDTQEISIDWPITYTPQGMRLTLFGEDAALQRTVNAIPDKIRMTLERTGEYQPGMHDPTWQLTERQQEIVRTAIATGYYDIPRRATQRDLAADLDLSRGTIGEHLRRAEVKIIRSVVE